MSFVYKIVANTLSIMIGAYFLSGVHVDGWLTGFVVALVLAFLNSVFKPLFIILTIPITVISFGLFLFAVNAILILIADWAVSDFTVDGFWWALLFSFILSILNSVFLGNQKKGEGKQDFDRLD